MQGEANWTIVTKLGVSEQGGSQAQLAALLLLLARKEAQQ